MLEAQRAVETLELYYNELMNLNKAGLLSEVPLPAECLIAATGHIGGTSDIHQAFLEAISPTNIPFREQIKFPLRAMSEPNICA